MSDSNSNYHYSLPLANLTFLICFFFQEKSTADWIRLRHLDFSSAGQYKCEVSTDAPSFLTNNGKFNLTVIRKCKFFYFYNFVAKNKKITLKLN